MSIGQTLFPPANREAAVVAFLRTFWQVVRGTGLLGGSGLIVVSAAQIAVIDLKTLAFTVGAILASAILSGLLAAGDILAHGLPDAYTNAAAPVTVAPPAPPAPDPSVPAPPVADPAVPTI